jgi:hypothetical protein
MSDTSLNTERGQTKHRYDITAHAEGNAVLTVEATSEDEAVRIAYEEHLTGIDIGVGIANWEIDDVHEVQS